MTFEPTRPTTPEPFAPAAPEASAVPTEPVVPASPGVISPAPTARRRSGGGWLNAVLVIAAAVAIGGVAFAIGRGTAPVSAATGTGRIFAGNGGVPTGSFEPGANGGSGFGRGGFGGGGLTVSGTVESVDGDTLTIKTPSGQTIEVTTGADTTYHTQAPAAAADVTTGASVQVEVQLDGAAGGFRPGASAAPAGPVGTAGSVTVIP